MSYILNEYKIIFLYTNVASESSANKNDVQAV